MKTHRNIIIIFVLIALLTTCSQHKNQADGIVKQLRDLPTPIPNEPSFGPGLPSEIKRRKLYGQLRALGNEAVYALSSGLQDEDVNMRKNAALCLNELSGGWFDNSRPRLDIRLGLSTLINALKDNDGSVRAWSAQAIGNIGPEAVQAVPFLIELLKSVDEGSRNSACIGLKGIGPAAKHALPALQNALNDPSSDVRKFSRWAIAYIDK